MEIQDEKYWIIAKEYKKLKQVQYFKGLEGTKRIHTFSIFDEVACFKSKDIAEAYVKYLNILKPGVYFVLTVWISEGGKKVMTFREQQ